MPRYAALLRGVAPMNLKMPALKQALETAGFSDVKTVLSSGNAVFGARKRSPAALRKQVEAALEQHVGRVFRTFIRSIDELAALLDSDPYRGLKLAPGTKRVITFLPAPPTDLPKLPIRMEDARILAVRGDAVLSAYLPGPQGPVFMTLIERTFGKDVTTRTWDTVAKVVNAGTAR